MRLELFEDKRGGPPLDRLDFFHLPKIVHRGVGKNEKLALIYKDIHQEICESDSYVDRRSRKRCARHGGQTDRECQLPRLAAQTGTSVDRKRSGHPIPA